MDEKISVNQTQENVRNIIHSDWVRLVPIEGFNEEIRSHHTVECTKGGIYKDMYSQNLVLKQQSCPFLIPKQDKLTLFSSLEEFLESWSYFSIINKSCNGLTLYYSDIFLVQCLFYALSSQPIETEIHPLPCLYRKI